MNRLQLLFFLLCVASILFLLCAATPALAAGPFTTFTRTIDYHATCAGAQTSLTITNMDIASFLQDKDNKESTLVVIHVPALAQFSCPTVSIVGPIAQLRLVNFSSTIDNAHVRVTDISCQQTNDEMGAERSEVNSRGCIVFSDAIEKSNLQISGVTMNNMVLAPDQPIHRRNEFVNFGVIVTFQDLNENQGAGEGGRVASVGDSVVNITGCSAKVDLKNIFDIFLSFVNVKSSFSGSFFASGNSFTVNGAEVFLQQFALIRFGSSDNGVSFDSFEVVDNTLTATLRDAALGNPNNNNQASTGGSLFFMIGSIAPMSLGGGVFNVSRNVFELAVDGAARTRDASAIPFCNLFLARNEFENSTAPLYFQHNVFRVVSYVSVVSPRVIMFLFGGAVRNTAGGFVFNNNTFLVNITDALKVPSAGATATLMVIDHIWFANSVADAGPIHVVSSRTLAPQLTADASKATGGGRLFWAFLRFAKALSGGESSSVRVAGCSVSVENVFLHNTGYLQFLYLLGGVNIGGAVQVSDSAFSMTRVVINEHLIASAVNVALPSTSTRVELSSLRVERVEYTVLHVAAAVFVQSQFLELPVFSRPQGSEPTSGFFVTATATEGGGIVLRDIASVHDNVSSSASSGGALGISLWTTAGAVFVAGAVDVSNCSLRASACACDSVYAQTSSVAVTFAGALFSSRLTVNRGNLSVRGLYIESTDFLRGESVRVLGWRVTGALSVPRGSIVFDDWAAVLNCAPGAQEVLDYYAFYYVIAAQLGAVSSSSLSSSSAVVSLSRMTVDVRVTTAIGDGAEQKAGFVNTLIVRVLLLIGKLETPGLAISDSTVKCRVDAGTKTSAGSNVASILYADGGALLSNLPLVVHNASVRVFQGAPQGFLYRPSAEAQDFVLARRFYAVVVGLSVGVLFDDSSSSAATMVNISECSTFFVGFGQANVSVLEFAFAVDQRAAAATSLVISDCKSSFGGVSVGGSGDETTVTIVRAPNGAVNISSSSVEFRRNALDVSSVHPHNYAHAGIFYIAEFQVGLPSEPQRNSPSRFGSIALLDSSAKVYCIHTAAVVFALLHMCETAHVSGDIAISRFGRFLPSSANIFVVNASSLSFGTAFHLLRFVAGSVAGTVSLTDSSASPRCYSGLGCHLRGCQLGTTLVRRTDGLNFAARLLVARNEFTGRAARSTFAAGALPNYVSRVQLIVVVLPVVAVVVESNILLVAFAQGPRAVQFYSEYQVDWAPVADSLSPPPAVVYNNFTNNTFSSFYAVNLGVFVKFVSQSIPQGSNARRPRYEVVLAANKFELDRDGDGIISWNNNNNYNAIGALNWILFSNADHFAASRGAAHFQLDGNSVTTDGAVDGSDSAPPLNFTIPLLTPADAKSGAQNTSWTIGCNNFFGAGRSDSNRRVLRAFRDEFASTASSIDFSGECALTATKSISRSAPSLGSPSESDNGTATLADDSPTPSPPHTESKLDSLSREHSPSELSKSLSVSLDAQSATVTDDEHLRSDTRLASLSASISPTRVVVRSKPTASATRERTPPPPPPAPRILDAIPIPRAVTEAASLVAAVSSPAAYQLTRKSLALAALAQCPSPDGTIEPAGLDSSPTTLRLLARPRPAQTLPKDSKDNIESLSSFSGAILGNAIICFASFVVALLVALGAAVSKGSSISKSMSETRVGWSYLPLEIFGPASASGMGTLASLALRGGNDAVNAPATGEIVILLLGVAVFVAVPALVAVRIVRGADAAALLEENEMYDSNSCSCSKSHDAAAAAGAARSPAGSDEDEDDDHEHNNNNNNNELDASLLPPPAATAASDPNVSVLASSRAALERLWNTLMEQTHEWRQNEKDDQDVVRRFGPVFEHLSFPIFIALDYVVALGIAACSGVAANCKSGSCCQGVVVTAFVLALLHVIAVLVVRPLFKFRHSLFLSRWELFFNTMASLLTFGEAVLVLLVSVFGIELHFGALTILPSVAAVFGLAAVALVFLPLLVITVLKMWNRIRRIGKKMTKKIKKQQQREDGSKKKMTKKEKRDNKKRKLEEKAEKKRLREERRQRREEQKEAAAAKRRTARSAASPTSTAAAAAAPTTSHSPRLSEIVQNSNNNTDDDDQQIMKEMLQSVPAPAVVADSSHPSPAINVDDDDDDDLLIIPHLEASSLFELRIAPDAYSEYEGGGTGSDDDDDDDVEEEEEEEEEAVASSDDDSVEMRELAGEPLPQEDLERLLGVKFVSPRSE